MRALVPWKPFSGLSTLHRDLDDLFAGFFGETEWPVASEWHLPKVESFLREGELVVRIDLPGIDAKDVDLSIEGSRLIVRGERKAKDESRGEHFMYREVSYGRFERVVQLPEGVDATGIKATYHDGVLEITMKAPKQMVSKKVPIAVH